MLTALVVDDQESVLYRLAEFIEQSGFSAATAATFADARDELRVQVPDLMLLDVLLPDGNGIDLLLDIPPSKRAHVLLMSGDDEVQGVVERMALQYVQFLRKPIDLDELAERIETIRRQRPAPSEGVRFSDMLGRSNAMREVFRLIEKVAPTDFPVYIEGESGTGKELVARAVHDRSRRASQPFVAINCGALPEGLVDSELFGHEKGAFTGATGAKQGVFEQADGGTLFLDELAEMPLDNQVRLLRVLETGRIKRLGGSLEIDVDVRVLAATNRTAERAIADGRLREDLFHRLSVFPIQLAPLRERADDVEELVRAFLTEAGEREGCEKTIDERALEALRAYRWPGNVRQLKNAVQRAYIVADDEITLDCLAPQIRGRVEMPRSGSGGLALEVGTTIADAERRLIEATLEKHDGDKKATAETLGISLRTLYNRLKEYGASGGEG